jgi:hypothetical protein
VKHKQVVFVLFLRHRHRLHRTKSSRNQHLSAQFRTAIRPQHQFQAAPRFRISAWASLPPPQHHRLAPLRTEAIHLIRHQQLRHRQCIHRTLPLRHPRCTRLQRRLFPSSVTVLRPETEIPEVSTLRLCKATPATLRRTHRLPQSILRIKSVSQSLSVSERRLQVSTQ